MKQRNPVVRQDLPAAGAMRAHPASVPNRQPCCFADLGSDQDRLKWYAEAEKTNGRWAMAAVAVSQQHDRQPLAECSFPSAIVLSVAAEPAVVRLGRGRWRSGLTAVAWPCRASWARSFWGCSLRGTCMGRRSTGELKQHVLPDKHGPGALSNRKPYNRFTRAVAVLLWGCHVSASKQLAGRLRHHMGVVPQRSLPGAGCPSTPSLVSCSPSLASLS